MWVVLKRHAYLGGNFYYQDPRGTEMPDELKDLLPRDAKVIDEPLPLKPTKPEPKALSELAARDFPPPAADKKK